jgi:hypothetical protein
MDITVRISNGRYCGQVRDGRRLMHHTPGYLTEAMALADAKCWAAFNDQGETVEEIVKDTDTFETRSGYDGSLQVVGPDRMRATIANARQHGVSVSVMTGEGGRKYINIHNGGSSYGRYFYAAS